MAPPVPVIPSLAELLGELRDARFSRGLACPRCGGRRVRRWGSFSGRQRYRCRRCKRTFSDLTGTPAAYSKKLHLWPAYSRCMARGLTVRAAATRIAVHPSTAFRWRHRYLDRARDLDGERLIGWIEIATYRQLYSEKGKRRVRGGAVDSSHSPPSAPRVGRLHANVLVACDRLGHVITDLYGISTSGSLDRESVARALSSRTDRRLNVTAVHGPMGAASAFALSRQGAYHDPRGIARGRSPLAHTRTTTDYILRLRRWLKRFRGVATHYLPNYLVWHRLVDRSHRWSTAKAIRRWPIGTGFI